MRSRVVAVAVAAVLTAVVGSVPSRALEPSDPSLDTEKATLDGSPTDALPPHIRRVLRTGMRPDWSPDGRALLYLDAPLGDVWRLDLATGARRNLTGRLRTHGFLRAHHLVNGDVVLCGPAREPQGDGPEAGRFDGVLWILRAPYTGPVVPLGRPCWEGVAVSKRRLRIAWNESAVDFTTPQGLAQAVAGKSEIWSGDIAYAGGVPELTNVRRVVTRWESVPAATIEVQDFRGRDDSQVVFTAYGYLTGEVMTYDTRTGRAVDHTNSPFYEEAEGTAPDGSFVLVERDLMVNPIPGALDIWRLSLDGRRTWQRLTHFNRHRGYGASNPVVSPDGRSVAFQLSLAEGAEGEGAGLFVLDLARASRQPGGQ